MSAALAAQSDKIKLCLGAKHCALAVIRQGLALTVNGRERVKAGLAVTASALLGSELPVKLFVQGVKNLHLQRSVFYAFAS